MPSPVVGKAFYKCPAQLVVESDTFSYYRPLLAPLVDAPASGSPGQWVPCWQDSNTQPTTFVVAVNDRASPAAARNPAVHDGIATFVAAAVFLGHTLAAAQAAARADASLGTAAAARIVDQAVGGE
jgi:hypothetical protein